MKAISLWQPWASLMAMGLKKNETRHWYTGYRGPLLIHAAKRKPRKYEIDHIAISLINHGRANSFSFVDLPYGAIVCQVDLKSCIKTREGDNPGGLEKHLGDYAPGRFMWITDNLKQLKDPIPFRGSQGFFNVPNNLIPKGE